MNFLINRLTHPNRLKVPYRLDHLYRPNPLSHLLFPQRHFHYQKNIPRPSIQFLHFLRLDRFNYSLHFHHSHLPRPYYLNEKNLLMPSVIFCEDVLKRMPATFPSPYFLTTDHHQKSTTRNQANTSHHYKISNRNYNFRILFAFMVSIAYSIGKHIIR